MKSTTLYLLSKCLKKKNQTTTYVPNKGIDVSITM